MKNIFLKTLSLAPALSACIIPTIVTSCNKTEQKEEPKIETHAEAYGFSYGNGILKEVITDNPKQFTVAPGAYNSINIYLKLDANDYKNENFVVSITGNDNIILKSYKITDIYFLNLSVAFKTKPTASVTEKFNIEINHSKGWKQIIGDFELSYTPKYEYNIIPISSRVKAEPQSAKYGYPYLATYQFYLPYDTLSTDFKYISTYRVETTKTGRKSISCTPRGGMSVREDRKMLTFSIQMSFTGAGLQKGDWLTFNDYIVGKDADGKILWMLETDNLYMYIENFI